VLAFRYRTGSVCSTDRSTKYWRSAHLILAMHGLRKGSVPRPCYLRSLPLRGPGLRHHPPDIDIISGVKRSTTSCGRHPSRKWRSDSEYPMWLSRSSVAARQSPPRDGVTGSEPRPVNRLIQLL
jgi:hypothetical protein